MNTKSLFLILAIIIVSTSCLEKKQNSISDEVNLFEVYSENEADLSFVNKYAKHLKNTVQVYNINDDEFIDEISKLVSKSNELNQSIEFEINYIKNDTMYFVQNNIYKFNERSEVQTGWDVGERSFWTGVFNQNLAKKDFDEFRNPELHSLGDYSEYSEIRMGEQFMVILHIKWESLIIEYGQLVPEKNKLQLIENIKENFRAITKAYQ